MINMHGELTVILRVRYDFLEINLRMLYIKSVNSGEQSHLDTIKVVILFDPGKVSFYIIPLIQKIDPTIQVYQNENIMDLLEDCDSMISLNYSIVILDAMILQKPTLVLLPEKQNFENKIPIKNCAVLSTSDENQIESMISDLLYRKEICDELVRNRNNFVNNHITNQGIVYEKLVEVLESYG